MADVKAGRFQPVYILFGPDVVAADGIIELLKKTLVTPGLEAFDLETIHAPDLEHSTLTVDELIQRTRQLPFGSTRRLVLIRNIDMLNRGRGSRLRTLCAALAATPDTSTVVLTCNPGPEARERRAWLGLFTDCKLKDFVIDLRQPKFERLIELIRSGAARRKLSITPDAAALLVEIAGGETGILRGELDKLASTLEPGAVITIADICRLASPSREFGLNEFVTHFLNRDPAALAVLRRIEGMGASPVQIIAWLANGLFKLHALKTGTLPAAEIWKVPKGCDRRWQLAEVNRALHRLYRLNVAAVTGHPEPLALLDILTAMVCIRPKTGHREARLVS